MQTTINVDLSDPETFKLFTKLCSSGDEVFVPVENFDCFVAKILPTLMTPVALIVGDAVLTSRRFLGLYADSMGWGLKRYQVVQSEKVFEFAEIRGVGA